MAKASKKRKFPVLHTEDIDRLDNDALRNALIDKLSIAELNALNLQIQTLVQKTGLQIAKESTEEAYKRQFAVMMRVMRDRFGFGRKRLRRLWDACLEYIHDIDEGLLNTEEMLTCLKNEDGIVISWRVEI
jgi:hypothetical protein